MTQGSQAKLAVLIDADNASAGNLPALLAEVAKLGVAVVRRIYGDWTKPELKSWKEVLAEYAVQPIQQFRNTTGKNATDSALIIDAMDLLYTRRFDGFCLISSDSDFTRLASRIREEGLVVYGFGEKKTPRSLVSACDKFIFTEILDGGSADAGRPRSRKSAGELKADARFMSILGAAAESAADEEGWAHLGDVGSEILKRAPEFDPRNYGYPKLSDLVVGTGLFELDKRGQGPRGTVRVRLKKPRGE
jgi:uncharacterized LabA/DUF88 family protein